MKSINKRIAVSVILGLLLCIGAVAVHAAVLVPCVHWIPLHPAGDIVYGPYGPYVVPCTHIVRTHPAGDILY